MASLQAFNVLHLRPMTDWEERCGQAMFGNQPCSFDLAIGGRLQHLRQGCHRLEMDAFGKRL